jgi:hypothetical protein
MLKYLLAFLLLMHGLAHVTGLLGHWTSGSSAFPDQPWLLSEGITARAGLGRAFALLWLLALAGLFSAALGLLFKQAWWPTLAIAGAICSLLAIVPWVKVVPPGAYAGALLDLGILVALLGPWAERIIQALR